MHSLSPSQLDYMPFDARNKRTESTVRDPEDRVFKARLQTAHMHSLRRCSA